MPAYGEKALLKQSHWHHNNQANRVCYYADHTLYNNRHFCSCEGVNREFTIKQGIWQYKCDHPKTLGGGDLEVRVIPCKDVYKTEGMNLHFFG